MTEFGAAASSSISKWPYHVFLSFRGEDTRYGFTGKLYRALRERGIRTFIDDEGIRKGEEITPTLLKTIKESKTAIVVFSKDYASSTFCLTELAQILDCMKEPNDRFIWPVFYDVDPSDIRHQKGPYKEAFDQYEGVKDETMVKRWRLALTEAANMTGWPFDPRSKSYEYKTIDEIIQGVSQKIGIGLLHVARFPVGLESRVEYVCSLLNKEPHCEGATIVGIFGPGGIGKTTIARATYNEIAISFKDKCFLDNIKEYSICDVQQRLLSEILGEKDIKLKDYKNGISVITDRLCGKKVLLVLDDISTLEQLRALAGESNWFGSGSKIIVTTRDKSLLLNHGIYEVPELSDREARQLLILNAFKKEEEDPKYKEVINRAVEYGFGLPLALETFGSTFGRHRTVKEMESFLDIQEKFPNKTILQSLKVSYDSLEELYKEIFLDIACFYRGTSLRYATEILSARHGIDSEYCINILIDKSLVKLGERGYLNMHDLIQDMGQEIVRQESPDVGQRSRLWSKEDILHVLNENTGTATIQAMKHWFNFRYKKVEWSGEPFEKMKNLRVLSFSCSSKNFYQGPKCLPNSLRVVEWDYYPSLTLPEDFCLINLVILRLRHSCLKTLGKACKNFYNLRELDLSGSQDLEELSDIFKAVNLEVLNVSYCEKLTKIDDSVGDLTQLKMLNLRHTAIKILPESVEKLVAIKGLWLHDDKYSWESDLGALVLEGFEQLPEIRKIPRNIEVFSGNSKLLTSSSTKALLKQNFYHLRKLDLQRCENLKEFPDISGAANLEELDVSYCKKLTKIDDSVGYLSKLRLLVVKGCEMLDTFIVRGIELVSIEIINLKKCSNLHIFSEILAPIEKIKTLDLSGTAIKSLPKSIENFISLEALYLCFCKELRQLPNLACFHNLKTLDLNFCSELEEITELPPNIEVLSAWWCTSRLLLTQKFFNLVKLNLRSCRNLEELLDISGAANLEELDVSNCSKLTKIDDSVGHLAKLKVLNAQLCPMLDTFIAGGIKLVSLETLNLRYCDKLHAFPEILGSMENIISLDLGHTAIKLLPESMEKLVALERLWLSNIQENLSKDKDLSSKRDLFPICMSTLFLDGCEQLQEIRKIPPNIKVFFAENCKSLTSSLVRALLEQELQETRKTEFILPGNEISKWLHQNSIGGSVSFWAPRKFPQIALCAVVTGGPTIFISFVMHINGVTKHFVRLGKIKIEIDHIFLFDLRHFEKKVASELLAKEWNHVKFSLEGGTESRLKYIGVYVYNYDSCMEDILFENPIPQERIQVEAVHKIADSNLVSSSRDNNEEDEKLNKEIIDLTPETVSNIEKKKGQLKVDNVNLTLSLPLSEPSSDTTSHHDLQQQQQLTSINQQTSESFEIVGKAKGKGIIVHGGDAIEEKDKNAFEVTCQNALRSSNNESLTLDPMIGQYGSTRQKDQSTIINEGHDGCHPMEWECRFTHPKDQSTIIDRGHDRCDPMEWEYQLTHPKNRSTIIDDKSKNQIMGPSTEVVSSARKKEITLKVDAVDGPSFSTTSEIMRDLLLSDLQQQQQHLSNINHQVSKSSENFKIAKGKNIIVCGDNANEEKDSNILEKDQSTINDKGHDETESHKARVTCFDLFSYLVSFCSSSAAS